MLFTLSVTWAIFSKFCTLSRGRFHRLKEKRLFSWHRRVYNNVPDTRVQRVRTRAKYCIVERGGFFSFSSRRSVVSRTSKRRNVPQINHSGRTDLKLRRAFCRPAVSVRNNPTVWLIVRQCTRREYTHTPRESYSNSFEKKKTKNAQNARTNNTNVSYGTRC